MIADRTLTAIAKVVAIALLATGCASHDDGGNTVTPNGHASAAATARAAPIPAAAVTPKASLTRYTGHYPFDVIDGVSFLADPGVTRAVTRLVPDPTVRALVLGGEGPGTPIAVRDGKLLAWGCETHNCGNHDWSVAIASDSETATVCYHDAAVMHDQSRWYLAPGQAELRDGDCPSA